MILSPGTQCILFIAPVWFLAKTNSVSTSTKDLKNINKFKLNEWKPINSLRVSTIQHEPFMYRTDDEKSYDGIEYKLIEVIAEKEHLNLSIHAHQRFKASHFNQLLYK